MFEFANHGHAAIWAIVLALGACSGSSREQGALARFRVMEPPPDQLNRLEADGNLYASTAILHATIDGSVLVGQSEVLDPNTSLGPVTVRWTEAGSLDARNVPSSTLSDTAQASPICMSTDGSTVVLDHHGEHYVWTERQGLAKVDPPNLLFLGATSDDCTVWAGNTADPIENPPVVRVMRWTESTGVVVVGPLPGHTESSLVAMSGDGAVIFGWSSKPGESQLFRWTEASGATALGALPGYQACGSEVIASRDGKALAGSCTKGALEPQQAFVWTETTGMVSLGALANGVQVRAVAMTDDGSVVLGESFDSNSRTRAFRWSAATGMVVFEPLPGDDETAVTSSVPVGRFMSADGRVVVGVSRQHGAFGERVFRWTEASGFTLLPLLPGNDASGVRDISPDGSTILGFSAAGRQSTFVRWDDAMAVRPVAGDLAGGGVDLTGFELGTGWIVDERGRILRGMGGGAKGVRGWIAWLP